ncbi:hypothetical protein CVO76_10710 [Arthrobacter agilis]|uniref:HNH nuclease domain-containing protein n=2 Tax=Arthrobacter agilis TaxID=37921 RepID=A0A2L0UJG9_9MICC|nr:hypothetical protein CVO76_10710 [Arthrobacter agilis]
MVTIDYKDLIGDLQHVKRPGHAGDRGHAGDPGYAADSSQGGQAGHAGQISQAGHAGHSGRVGRAGHIGHAGYGVFSEQISARTIRTLACDADLIPLVLGSSGQVLDIGRSQRLFPPHLRRALVARDKGCAFPDCTIPASWCEAHHITPWSRGGGTNINNGVLLCTRHHHVIHQGLWTVESRHGIPWFHAPGNPGRAGTPRQNTYRRAGRIVYDKRPDQTISYTHTHTHTHTHTDPDPRR